MHITKAIDSNVLSGTVLFDNKPLRPLGI